jgi:hypothetical protein
MSMEHMGVRNEVWPLAADRHGIHLISGQWDNQGQWEPGPWRSGRLPADTTVKGEVDLLIAEHDIRLLAPPVQVPPLHSTSWRQQDTYGPNVYLTWAVYADPGNDDDVIATYPQARPLTTRVLEHVGQPRPHAANAVSEYIRDFDVLFHALRHLRFLRDHDSEARKAMSEHWLRELEPFGPALARMFEYDDVT